LFVMTLPDRRVKALLFVPGPAPGASFVSADREALSRRVRVLELVPGASWRRIAFAAAVARAMVLERPSAAVLWFAAPTYGAITAAACRAAGVPLLVVSGGGDVAACPEIGFGEARVPWRRAVVRWILEGASVVWAFSAAAAREVSAVAPAAVVRVVPPAVDTAFFASAVGARERLVVSTCAAITPLTIVQKGLDRLVEAARSVADAAFVITGEPAAGEPAVAAFVAAAPANVTFAGHVPREDLRALYARAAVVAQLSRHEGFGVAAVEAAAMGCRVVATRLPVFEEVLGGGVDAVPLDASAAVIAATIRDALEAPPPAGRWADLDRRYGVAVRDAAWGAWLAGDP
jgi:glycosyltransferase involved in cell wall biosynthesis